MWLHRACPRLPSSTGHPVHGGDLDRGAAADGLGSGTRSSDSMANGSDGIQGSYRSLRLQSRRSPGTKGAVSRDASPGPPHPGRTGPVAAELPLEPTLTL